MRELAVRLGGGLGNLLFIYTGAQTVAGQIGASVWYYNGDADSVERLEAFLGVVLPRGPNGRRPWRWLPVLWAGGRPASLPLWLSGLLLVAKEAGFARRREINVGPFDPMPDRLPAGRRVHLGGYLQHRTFYEPSLDQTLGLLADRAPDWDAWYRPDAVAVNLRRGDYVALGWELSLEHYLTGLQVCDDARERPVVVVGDDRLAVAAMEAWVRERGYQVVERGPGEFGPYGDFWTLAGAGSVVMSNSTFCWWATVLGDRLAGSVDRRVVFPRRWVPDGGADLRRPDWIPV